MLATEVYWTHLTHLGIPSLLPPGKPSWGFSVLHNLRGYTCRAHSVQPFLRLVEILWPRLTSVGSIDRYTVCSIPPAHWQTSRRAPLLLANSSCCQAYSGLSPPGYSPCLAHIEVKGKLQVIPLLLKNWILLHDKLPGHSRRMNITAEEISPSLSGGRKSIGSSSRTGNDLPRKDGLGSRGICIH